MRVVTEHDRLEAVLRDGLAVLDKWPTASPGGSAVKTHFVLIDYADGQYDIRSRQHDETTGLASPGPTGLNGRSHPVIRQQRTQDRAFVGALAAELVEQDLGLLGTVQEVAAKESKATPDQEGQKVKVRFQGGSLAGRLVQPGRGRLTAVVAPSEPKVPGRVLSWSLLRVEPSRDGVWPPPDGVCECRYFSRYDDLPPQGGSVHPAGHGHGAKLRS